MRGGGGGGGIKFLYGGRYRRASGMDPVFRSGNIFMDILSILKYMNFQNV